MQPKYLINSDNFKPGFVTPNDGWKNYWRQGQNSVYGWSTSLPGSGTGAKSMGTELANSDQFARCQVEKVFKDRLPASAGQCRGSCRGRFDHQPVQGRRLQAQRRIRQYRRVLQGQLKGMYRMKTLRLTLLGAAIALLAACSGGASTAVNNNPTQQGSGDDYAGPAPLTRTSSPSASTSGRT